MVGNFDFRIKRKYIHIHINSTMYVFCIYRERGYIYVYIGTNLMSQRKICSQKNPGHFVTYRAQFHISTR